MLTHRCVIESEPPRRKVAKEKVNHVGMESTEKMSLRVNACREFSVLSVSPWRDILATLRLGGLLSVLRPDYPRKSRHLSPLVSS